MSNILLATDGSKPSLRAEEFLSNTYDPSVDEVIVVSVAHIPSRLITDLGLGEEGTDPYESEVGKNFVENASDHGEDAAERLRAEGFSVDVSTPTGTPGPELCEVADERDVSCIVMGRRGMNSESDPSVGSVSQYVLHHASCPVNVVPL